MRSLARAFIAALVDTARLVWHDPVRLCRMVVVGIGRSAVDAAAERAMLDGRMLGLSDEQSREAIGRVAERHGWRHDRAQWDDVRAEMIRRAVAPSGGTFRS